MIWRKPPEESAGIYPGLVVCDNRVSGSITVGRSRLPLWAMISEVVRRGWQHAVDEYYPDPEELQQLPAEKREAIEKTYFSFDGERAAEFFYNLAQQRGEFGRLVLLLADVERVSTYSRNWTMTKKHRKRMIAQLKRCLALLESEGES